MSFSGASEHAVKPGKELSIVSSTSHILCFHIRVHGFTYFVRVCAHLVRVLLGNVIVEAEVYKRVHEMTDHPIYTGCVTGMLKGRDHLDLFRKYAPCIYGTFYAAQEYSRHVCW